ncbi:MAG: hypothetical protein WD749_01180 [Phycisphaerales bacterium]
MTRLWRAKWGLLRLALAAFLLWVVAADTGARLARLQLAAMPDFDYAAEVAYLRAAGRYGEAVMVADAGLASADAEAQPAIERERAATVDEQGSYLRRAKDLGLGALSGQGTSLESLIGAVAADFFIVGDIRDLVIQGGRWVVDGETDELILVLSGVGVATTVAPEVDWVPALLKAARKAGAMTRGLGEWVLRAAKSANKDALLAFCRDVKTLAEKASPGGAARLLRHAETPEDVAKLARFVERNPAGAFALHVSGRHGTDLVKGTARAADDAATLAADRVLIAAAKKGERGLAWHRAGGWRPLARPHLVVGVAKALWKGNAEELAARLAAALDPRGWWLVPLLGAWVVFELTLLAWRARAQAAFRSGLGPATA